MASPAPLIITLSLDEPAFAFFNALRQAHFPPHRNYLQAHLTLFHHLPAGEPSLIDTLRRTAAGHTAFPLAVTGVAFTGNGVAYKVESGQLLQLHRSLQEAWSAWLTAQDRQRLRPHVTVQNKVPPEQARALFEQLSEAFTPFTALATGLEVWVYRGGPWEAMATYPFTGKGDEQ